MDSLEICLEPELPKLVSRFLDLHFSLKMDFWKDEITMKIFGVVSIYEMLPIILIKLK